MKNPIALLLIALIISLSSCTKNCSDWYEGKKCDEKIIDRHLGTWIGPLTGTVVTVGDTSFISNIPSDTLEFLSDASCGYNEIKVKFTFECYCGISCGCPTNPMMLPLLLRFKNAEEFDVIDPTDRVTKYGVGVILSGENPIETFMTFKLFFNNTSSTFPIHSGSYYFDGHRL